jgi:hypothetical protein
MTTGWADFVGVMIKTNSLEQRLCERLQLAKHFPCVFPKKLQAWGNPGRRQRNPGERESGGEWSPQNPKEQF